MLFSAALRLHGLPSRSPITMPRSSAATLSYLRFDINAYLQSTRIAIDSLGTSLTLPVSFLPLARKVCSRVKVTENLAFRDRSRNLRLIDRFCETGRVLFLPTTDLRSLIREKDYIITIIVITTTIFRQTKNKFLKVKEERTIWLYLSYPTIFFHECRLDPTSLRSPLNYRRHPRRVFDFFDDEGYRSG